MHRLLKRQIKRTFPKDFDISTLNEDIQNLLKAIDNSYEEFDKERKLLENTLEVNSKELTQLNQLIKEKNIETLALLEQYKEAIDATMIVSKSDIHRKITYVNSLFCDISGYTKEELIGQPHSIIRHEQTPPSTFKELWETILAKKIWSGFLANRAKNGETYYVQATIIPILDISGNIVEFMALREDVTERFLLEKERKHLLERTQHIMDAQESMIIISDDTHGVVEANKKFYDITGFESFEAFKKEHQCICELFVEREGYLQTSRDDYYWAMPLLESPHLIHKAILHNAKQEERIFDVRGKTITLDENEYIISTFSDITEIELLRVKAEEAQKAKSEFLANMSHEIRTPMNGISGFLQLLEKSPLDATQKKYLDITQSSVKSLLKIINDILDFSKIESGNMEADYITINPFVEFEKSFIAMEPQARQKRLSFQIHLDDTLYECLEVDELHIRQVMHNLINNAIKFTPNEGSVIAKVAVLEDTATSQTLQFSVQDSGIGIPKDKLSKILEPFSQADTSTTREFGGTGIGLSISKSLVELMGGALMIESEPNRGSRFFFELTLQKCHSKESLHTHLQSKRIALIKEDNSTIDHIIQQLEHFNVHFDICTLEDLTTKNYHLIITLSEHNLSYLPKESTIVLISETTQLQSYDNIHVIESYEQCPSRLYNLLLSKSLTHHNPLPTQKDEKKSFKLNVLVVEDYEINRILMEELLKEYADLHYSFAFNGQEAIERYKTSQNTTPYDLIFMDINMPILDGIEATKVLRNMGCTTPIVALTANALEGDKERFLAIGMDDYISKPIDVNALERVLKNYTENTEKKAKDSEPKEPRAFENIEDAIAQTIKKTRLPQAVVMRLMQSYVDGLVSLIELIESGIATSDYEAISRGAHDIKSSSLTVGFNTIGEMAATVEIKAKAHEIYDYNLALEQFKNHYKIVLDALKTLK